MSDETQDNIRFVFNTVEHGGVMYGATQVVVWLGRTPIEGIGVYAQRPGADPQKWVTTPEAAVDWLEKRGLDRYHARKLVDDTVAQDPNRSTR
jgi:hypothetical protein